MEDDLKDETGPSKSVESHRRRENRQSSEEDGSKRYSKESDGSRSLAERKGGGGGRGKKFPHPRANPTPYKYKMTRLEQRRLSLTRPSMIYKKRAFLKIVVGGHLDGTN